MNLLAEHIETLRAGVLKEATCHSKPVVQLEDAIRILEELEAKMWSLCEQEINRAHRVTYY